MAPKAPEGTRWRGGKLHLKLRIPVELAPLYDGKTHLEGSLKTADPKVAADAVTLVRGRFIKQAAEVRTAADSAAQLDKLTPAQRALYDEAGGLDGLLKAFAATRTAQAFMLAGSPSFDAGAEIEDTPDGPRKVIGGEEDLPPLQVEIEAAEHRAASAALAGQARLDAKTLRALGQKVEIPGGGDGIAELAEDFAKEKGYTVQNLESLRYTVRRWIEFHGDLPLAELTRDHLYQFDQALRDLPVAREYLKVPMRRAIEAGRKAKADTISFKTRERLVATHLKPMVAFAVNIGGVPADPWAGYKMTKPKVKVAEQKKASDVPPFTPAEVKMILAHTATFNPVTADFWLPIFGAYTGARMEELAQANVKDVLTDSNIPALRITDEEAMQKVKNAHSFRTFPIPPAALAAGFLDFVERRRKEGGVMLFLEEHHDKRRQITVREIAPDGRGRYSQNFGQRFTRKVLDPLGIKKPGQGFHALRHSWTDAARRAKLNPEIRRLIAGRLEDTDPTEANYGGAPLLPEKLDALIAVAPFVTE